MTSELVKRLRMDVEPTDGDMEEAADRIEALERENAALRVALEAQSSVIHNCQAVMGDYLPPGGIAGDEAISRLLYLLDGPEQRAAQSLTDAALKEATNG